VRLFVTGTRGIPFIQGGIETHCQELYPRLITYGWDITLATRKVYVRKDMILFKGVRLIPLPSPQLKGLEAFIHTFIAVLYAKFRGFKILHIHAIGPSLFVPLARMLGFKVVVTNHGQDYHRRKWGQLSKAVLKFGEMIGSLCAHKIIAVSHGIRQCIERKYGRRDVVVIPNGVSLQEPCHQTNFIEALGLKPGKYILGVGRLVPEKGFHDLVEAFSRVGNGDIQCVLTGDAEPETTYSHTLKLTARNRGCILTGFLRGDALRQLYSHAGLFVLPSYHEGLSIALLEAMSFDCNVLVSDIKENREIGLPAASYFKTGNVDDLSKRIREVLYSRKHISLKEILHKRYDWDSIAEKTHRILMEICH
jgi:starch synthase